MKKQSPPTIDPDFISVDATPAIKHQAATIEKATTEGGWGVFSVIEIKAAGLRFVLNNDGSWEGFKEP